MKPGVVWRRKPQSLEYTPARRAIGFLGGEQPARSKVVSGSIANAIAWKRISIPTIEKRRL